MTQYKDFSNSKVISIDCETYDPDLLTKGPAIHRGGRVLGFSVADDTGFAEYYNLTHKDATEEEREKNLAYLKEILLLDVPKLGQNLLYDLDWFQNYLGLQFKGQVWDLMSAEALINENQMRYSLDFMAEKYIGLGKIKTKIDAFCEYHGLKGDPRMWLWKMDYPTVRDYAIGDVKLPIEIFKTQWKLMEKDEVLSLFHMEMGLYPLLINMRKNGVLVNVKKLRVLEDQVSDMLIVAERKLYSYVGFEINYNSAIDLGTACRKLKIGYPLTPKTKKPSFQQPWLKANRKEHELFDLVLKCRRYHKLVSTFLESQIKHQIIGDRIYGQFHPCKADDGGTVTGRFSASNPNLQFIPNPKSYEDEEEEQDINVGREIRSLFLPMENHLWGKHDYSQIELRLLAHFAVGPKSDEIREAFSINPKIDYHQWCAEISGTSRHIAKKINFGTIFGMGVDKLCKSFDMSREEGEAFLIEYLERLPFIKRTLYAVKGRAESRGYVKTILGRRRRFPLRDFTYKALNAVIQGSAADIMKKSMKDSWDAGIYNELIPLLTVHDEMDNSVPNTKHGLEAFREQARIMENTVKIKVPIVVDSELGPNWGYLEPYENKALQLPLEVVE